MNARLIAGGVLLTTLAFGDVITLKSGRKIEGTFLSGDSRQIRMALDDNVRSFPIDEVEEIKFGSPSPMTAARPSVRREAPPVRAEVPPVRAEVPASDRSPAASSQSRSSDLPSGTSIVIRMIDDIDSERDRVGQEFRASVDESVVVNGETIIPRGASVLAKLVADKQSGALTGRTELTLDLVSVEVNGRMAEISTQEVTQASESRTGRTGKVVGSTAALGAVTGAAAGGAVQVITKGERVQIPSETRLTFVLQQPLGIEPR